MGTEHKRKHRESTRAYLFRFLQLQINVNIIKIVNDSCVAWQNNIFNYQTLNFVEFMNTPNFDFSIQQMKNQQSDFCWNNS